MTSTQSRGWWRHNRWGLIAVVPSLVVAIGFTYSTAYNAYWKHHPREPVAAGEGGWVSYGGARIRLLGLAPAYNVKDYGGKPFGPPGTARIWRATLAFEVSDKDTLAGCDLLLEDTDGRTYSAGPSELRGARVPYPSCTQDSLATPSPRYEVAVYFVLPGTAKGAAVRVQLDTKLPHYARLTAAG
ncbi:MAG TPA: hypothetical protein VFE14_01295 [Micromonosporaceae bacterium]|jgi:hypothetical protein|nr:hypothetical protein [Micromonosporaceae bacterium]